MTDHKFLLYHHGSNKFVLFNNGDIMDVFEHIRREETYGKILLHKNNIHFLFEDQSFGKISNDKITSQDKKLNIKTENPTNIIINGNKYEFYEKYLRINSKKIMRIPHSSDMKCHGMYRVNNHLICIIDWEPGYCETPNTIIVMFDLNSNQIINKIKLKHFNPDSFSCTKHNKKIYIISTEFNFHTCPIGDYCILLIFNGKSYKIKYVYVNKNKKICKTKSIEGIFEKMDRTFSAPCSENFICFCNTKELIVYDIFNKTSVLYDYSYGKDACLHSFVPIS
ncbi:hypothetical protein [Acanthamoeba polyphaga mimivirus]|uniref:Uncharacterized protein n=1 Tax=Acanthamoeba polyphaga mimivirus TaxID=212035 RepID=A0A2L2DHX5_MIMIV|nr:hypothetical protein [Acanthamoeba polyphaga mimivirus]